MPVKPRKFNIKDASERARRAAELASQVEAQRIGKDVSTDEPAYERALVGMDLYNLEPPEYILDNYITTRSLIMINAAPNYGKSLVAVSWAMSLAHGIPWSGHEAKKSKVLYLTQEGTSGFPMRVQAWRQLRRWGPISENFILYPFHMDLGVRENQAQSGWTELTELVEHFEPEVIIIDPFADYFSGQENDARDVGAFTTKLREEFINKYGLTVIIPAHTSKASESGGSARGSSALPGAADREFTLSTVFRVDDKSAGYTTEGDPMCTKLSCKKAKDGARPNPWYAKFIEFDLDTTDMREDHDFGPGGAKSVVLDGIPREEFSRLEEAAKRGMAPADEFLDDAILRIVKDLGGVAKLADIKDAMDPTKYNLPSTNQMVRNMVGQGLLDNPERGVYALPGTEDLEEL